MYIIQFLWRKVIPLTSPPPVEMTHFPPCSPWRWGIFWPCGIFPQVYSDYESNPQLRQAIEFACHQFYILHRKPFVLQLFASVAPLLEFPVSKLWKSTKIKQTRKALYSQLAAARASPTITQVLAKTQRLTEERENFIGRGGKASGMFWLEAVGLVKLSVSRVDTGHPMWLVSGAYLVFSNWS